MRENVKTATAWSGLLTGVLVASVGGYLYGGSVDTARVTNDHKDGAYPGSAYVKAVSKTGETFFVLARPSDGNKECLVSLHVPDHEEWPTKFGSNYIKPENVISNPARIKALLDVNQGALGAAIGKNCEEGDRIVVLTDLDIVGLQRK